jgi:hypothetical protein
MPELQLRSAVESAVIVAALCGCATAPPDAPPVAATAEPYVQEVITLVPAPADLHCSTQRATGSHIARRTCVTRAEQVEISRASQEWIRSGGASGTPYLVPDVADPRVTVAEPR